MEMLTIVIHQRKYSNHSVCLPQINHASADICVARLEYYMYCTTCIFVCF